MKRKNEKVPGFDEIIFENRNKEYGAYDLRKHYDSATSISILGGVAFCVLLLIIFSLSMEKGKASDGPKSFPVYESTPIIPDPVKPEIKPPAELIHSLKNLAPVVSAESPENLPEMPTAEEVATTTTNRPVNDSSGFSDKPDLSEPVVQPPFFVVEEMPEFPGGLTELMKYIAKNIVYPDEAIRNNIQGRVIIRFAINTDGTTDRIEILKGVDAALDSEAIRVIKGLPRFKPGRQGGVPVPVWYSLPVLFKLENN